MGMKCWWVTVFERMKNADGKEKLTTILNEQCLSAQKATEVYTACKAKYVGPQYSIFREQY